MSKKKDFIVNQLNIGYSIGDTFPLENVFFYNYDNPRKKFKLNKEDIGIIQPYLYKENKTFQFYSKTNHKNCLKLYNFLKKC